MMIRVYIRWTYRDTVCHIPLWIVFQITGDAEHEYLGPYPGQGRIQDLFIGGVEISSEARDERSG